MCNKSIQKWEFICRLDVNICSVVSAENIFFEVGVRQVFKGGNYSKEESIQGQKLHEEIQYVQAWLFHFVNKVMTESYLDGLGTCISTWISVRLEVLLEDQRHCYRNYTQCKSVLMLLESNIMLQMDLQWIFHVVLQKNVIVLHYFKYESLE